MKVGCGEGMRYHAQAKGWPDHAKPADEWQDIAHGGNRDGLIRIAMAMADHPACEGVRIFDSVDNVVIDIEQD
jgi:hypothetical protein